MMGFIYGKYKDKNTNMEKPWGGYVRYVLNKKCSVKLIFIRPGEQISYQYHKKRDELWRVLDGRATMTIGGEKYKVSSTYEAFIPKRVPHMIAANKGKKTCMLLEISFGKFDENDIVRLSDKYGRVEK